jgi:hypothetical protein
MDGLKVPWGHGEQPEESAVFVKPGSQERQSEEAEEPTVLPDLPASHVVQAAVYGEEAYLPITQTAQSEMEVEPVEGLLLPTPQSVQVPPAPSWL